MENNSTQTRDFSGSRIGWYLWTCFVGVLVVCLFLPVSIVLFPFWIVGKLAIRYDGKEIDEGGGKGK